MVSARNDGSTQGSTAAAAATVATAAVADAEQVQRHWLDKAFERDQVQSSIPPHVPNGVERRTQKTGDSGASFWIAFSTYTSTSPTSGEVRVESRERVVTAAEAQRSAACDAERCGATELSDRQCLESSSPRSFRPPLAQALPVEGNEANIERANL